MKKILSMAVFCAVALSVISCGSDKNPCRRCRNQVAVVAEDTLAK